MTKKFIPLAKKVIDLEIQALQKLKKKIDNSFNKAVVEIAKCKSKVILCGVGKSGLIAAKISATLSSVGTPSFNLSASDSSHGDLGSVSKKDIKIFDPSDKQKKFLLDEIKRTSPLLKKYYKNNININNQLKFCSSIKEAVSDADLIQENTPENEKLKNW